MNPLDWIMDGYNGFIALVILMFVLWLYNSRKDKKEKAKQTTGLEDLNFRLRLAHKKCTESYQEYYAIQAKINEIEKQKVIQNDTIRTDSQPTQTFQPNPSTAYPGNQPKV